MKVSEAIARERPLLSLEITPPDDGCGIKNTFARLFIMGQGRAEAAVLGRIIG